MYFLEGKDFRQHRVDKMARRQIFLWVRWFFSIIIIIIIIIIPPVLHTHVLSYRHTARKILVIDGVVK